MRNSAGRPASRAFPRTSKAYVADDGTRAALLSAVSRPKPPALLSGLPSQQSDNGGLLCQDWTGFGSIKREHCVTGADIGDDANVSGMVAFCFACYGAGTLDRDDFFRRLGCRQPPAAGVAAVRGGATSQVAGSSQGQRAGGDRSR